MPRIPTDMLALYGAILSTLTFIITASLALLRFIESRRSLRVQASYGSYWTMAGPNPCIVITTINRGHRPLSILGGFIEAESVLMGAGDVDLSKTRRFNLIKQKLPILMDDEFPIRVEEGERATIRFHFNAVRDALAGMPMTGVFVVDGEEKWHYASLSSNLKLRLLEPIERTQPGIGA